MNKKNVSKPVRLPQIRKDRDYDCVYVMNYIRAMLK